MATPRPSFVTRARGRTRCSGAIATLACVGLLAACGGSRVAEEEVIAAEGGGAITVTAAPGSTLDTSITAPGAETATDPNAASSTAPGVTGPGTSPGAAPGSTSGGANAGKVEGAQGTGSSGQGAVGAQGAAACTKPGPPIILGQVVEYSGIIGANVGSAIPVLGAWQKWINAQGGIACHPVQVFSQDSASDPAKAASQVRDLVENKRAIAMVANFIPLSISGFKQALDQVKVPAVGGDLFSTTWWSDPLFYPVGTHVDANAFGSSAALAKAGADKVAVIYCIEAAICPPYKDALKRYTSSGGYQVVYDVQVSITAPDYTSQCQSAKNAGATQINMIVEGATVSRIARSCAAIGYFPKFAIASMGATFDPADKNVQKMTATIASASADWFSTGVEGQKAFQEAMKRYAPGVRLAVASPLAWADAMMVKVAIEKLGAKAVGVPITPAMLRQGLAMVKNETLGGLIKPTSFSPTQGPNPPNPCYFAEVFSAPGNEGQWATSTAGCLKGLEGAASSSVAGAVASGAAAPSLAATLRSRDGN